MSREQLKELRADIEEGANERGEWEADLWRNLAHLRKRVHSLGKNLEIVDGAEQLRSIVSGVEKQLEGFKDRQRKHYDAFAFTESTLQDTLESMQERFEGWVRGPSALCRVQESVRSKTTAGSARSSSER